MFEVIISSTARKSVKRLPEHYKKRTVELLLVLRENPIPTEEYDIKKLKGYTDTYRARIGDIRIIYEITWNFKRIHVLLVERREQAYT